MLFEIVSIKHIVSKYFFNNIKEKNIGVL